ncbi:MAG: hypothetical protein Q4Q07_09830, partial [Tissierellia bacterium]|nr:hypothetical protein [Tissierellia bacterium]
MKQRILCFLLTFVLLFGSLPMAFAQVEASVKEPVEVKTEEQENTLPPGEGKEEPKDEVKDLPKSEVDETKNLPKKDLEDKGLELIEVPKALEEKEVIALGDEPIEKTPLRGIRQITGPIKTQEELASMTNGDYELGAD